LLNSGQGQILALDGSVTQDPKPTSSSRLLNASDDARALRLQMNFDTALIPSLLTNQQPDHRSKYAYYRDASLLHLITHVAGAHVDHS
jgi:hypothetical protein